MGCICSKGAKEDEIIECKENAKDSGKSAVQLIAPPPSKREEFSEKAGNAGGSKRDGSVRRSLRSYGAIYPMDEGDNKTKIVERATKAHRRWPTDGGLTGWQPPNVTKPVYIARGAEAELVAAGWPWWLTSVAAEAIWGWIPRPAESFEKLDRIGQGTYSSVYKARDLETGKIVAMKKVRFVNMEPESVRFMAREICILRKLDHPNVMKLEGLVTSRMSTSLYLVFEYMEHDLAGLAARPGVKFTEPQIKCYMQQLFRGLEHCHNRGILHRDLKGSNLLINDEGVLKIGDFGLANFWKPDQNNLLTSRVVTLWYRAPELLLGATNYGPGIDLWSAGCILAELFVGKPIMPGRTEVEQMHKIFKLCGSPSEDYWRKTKLPLATSFKPHQPYRRVLAETFRNLPSSALALVDKLLTLEPEKRELASSALKSKFFTTKPLPCDSSSLPKYPPSKELDAKIRNEEVRRNFRQKAETVRGRGPDSVRRGSRDIKADATPEFIASGQSKATTSSHRIIFHEQGGGAWRTEARDNRKNAMSHSSSMIHSSGAGSLDRSRISTNTPHVTQQKSHMAHITGDLSVSSHKYRSSNEQPMGLYCKKNRIHHSGLLVPPGGNMEDILREHERQIQEAVRKSRVVK